MTEQTPVLHPTPTIVKPDGRSRLAQLHALYPEAKAAADAATERLKEITDGIKAELMAAAPEQTRVELQGNGPALRLTYSERWTFDSKKLKADNPALWVSYGVKGGSWRLAVVKDGDDQ